MYGRKTILNNPGRNPSWRTRRRCSASPPSPASPTASSAWRRAAGAAEASARRPATAAALLLGPPEVPGQPVEPQILERLGEGLAGLAVVAHLHVPGVDHLLPLLADGLPLGRAVVRRGACPTTAKWTGTPLSRVPVPAVQVSSISSQRPR